MRKVAIIGNGFSQELFSPGPDWDLVVGCNFPRFKVDVSAFADGRAARLLRVAAEHHRRLGEFQLVLGARAARTLTQCKHAPGQEPNCLDWLTDLGFVEDILDYGDFLVSEQRNFNSGHLAFLWATTCAIAPGEVPPAIHLFGFDSLFGQPHGQSTSLWDVPLNDGLDIAKKCTVVSKHGWNDQWVRLLERCSYSQMVLHCYETDPDHPFQGVPNVRIQRHTQPRTGRPPPSLGPGASLRGS